MRHLTLQRKAFLALSALMAVMLLMFVGLSRLGLQRGMGPYVAEIELARMDWFAVRLQRLHAQHGGWQTLRAEPDLWLDLRRPEMPNTPVFGPGPAPSTAPPAITPPLLDDWLVEPRHPGGMGLRPPPYGAAPPAWASGDGTSASRSGPQQTPQGSSGAPPPPFSDGLSQRLGLLDNDRNLIAGSAPQAGHARTVLRNAEGRPIGQLVLSPPLVLEREADQAFLGQQLVFVVWTGAAGLAFALVLSWWLGRRWLAPVGALVAAARSIAAGRLDTRVPTQTSHEGGHELARLVDTFNHMAEQLASMEASRRQWIGDVAHELRTPLAAMRAEIEAVQDGVRQFDDTTALRLHRQVMRLTHLVGDLRASLDEGGSGQPAAMDPVHPLPLLAEAITSMQPRFEQAGVALHAAGLPAQLTGNGSQPLVRGDAQQLHRVFLNLLENSLRYTDSGGRLEVSATVERGDNARPVLSLRFDDTAPGVPAPELPRIFERLYRAEASRTRTNGDRGGSGLGLAICRAIVQAHGGHIGAEASPLGGLRVHLTLPLLERAP
ncbi:MULTISPECIES: ATP-binding protein [unclassified Acidovorax]|uniref:ATP-binding protein n=1 Tax=unclassified Acidovorax TaxID=2684926 RepID=UPI0028832CA8|nr:MULTISPECIES: ATP-binding protein [unclassified Acidovorax]